MMPLLSILLYDTLGCFQPNVGSHTDSPKKCRAAGFARKLFQRERQSLIPAHGKKAAKKLILGRF